MPLKAIIPDHSGIFKMKEIQRPELKTGDVLVEMKMCGLCGTDIEKLRGEYTASMPKLGHEPVGVVAEVGESVAGIEVGERVFAHHHVPCYHCYFCSRGSETMCSNYRGTNLDPCGFAEYFRVPAWNVSRGGVLKLPETVNFEEGIFIEPTACCVRGLRRLGVSDGDSVLISGAGPMGLTFLQLLSGYSGSEIFVTDLSELRLSYAKKLGASVVLNPEHDKICNEIKAATDGRGVDLAVIASGSPKALTQALDTVRRGGKILLFGLPPVGSRLDYDLSEILNREINIISSNAATEEDTHKALDHIKGKKIDIKSMITHNFTLNEFDEAVESMEKGKCVKVAMIP